MNLIAKNFGETVTQTAESVGQKLQDTILSLTKYPYFETIFSRITKILENYDNIEPARNMPYRDITATGLDDIIIVDGNMWHIINNSGQIGTISEISKLIKQYFSLKKEQEISKVQTSPLNIVAANAQSKSSLLYFIPVFAIAIVGGIFFMKYLKKRNQ